MSSATEILTKHKLRITPVRKDVVRIFLESGCALSSSDIEERLVDSDRITLYRTLKSFEEKGIIHKAYDGTLVQKYALCESHCDEKHHHDEHVHFRCQVCEHTFCVEGVKVPSGSLPDGFIIAQTDMVITGTCTACIKNQIRAKA